MKKFSTRYGRFSRDGKEYIITTPRTPRPWINVISNGDYGVAVSQTGGGYSWRTHAQLNRLTRWDQDLIKDEWGKYIYIQDDRGNVWSAGWKPVAAEPDMYRCRHGLGYTVIESRNHGIETDLLLLVPVDAPMELWQLTIRNRSRSKRTLRFTSYLEWGLGQAPDWHREFHKSFIETVYDPDAHAVLATKRLWEVPTGRGHWNTDWPFVAFHSANLKPSSYDADKESFLGMYGNPAMPAALNRVTLDRRTGNSLDPIASLRHTITFAPDQEATLIYSLGCAENREEAVELSRRFRSEEDVSTAKEAVDRHWAGLLGTVQVDTPDDAMNLMENTWLKYQAISGRMWGRTAYYQTGGAYGFRDQLQDSQLWLPIDAGRTEQQLRLHARHQFADGTVYHWWHPMSEIGLHNAISDNLLWLPFVLFAYIQETGEISILDHRERFVDQAEPVPMYDHCTRAVDRALERYSERGLPLIGEGDWNDGLSAVGLDGRGESVWLGHFLHRILLDMAGVAVRRGDDTRAVRYRERAETLRKRLNTLAWDGTYYFGATKDSGERLGSHLNQEGRIWLNPQTWSIIGGVADDLRGNQVFDIVERELEFDIGPLLLYPAYSKPDREVGYLTRYSPGMRENGGVYTHGATWAVIAAAMLGRGESAYRLYGKLNPINRGRKPDVYCAEPYVTAGNIEGPDSPFYGRGGWTWYTGSAAWMFKVGLEWILGVRATIDGLMVDPCIPPAWDGYTVRRTFRGVVYTIVVKNPGHVACGVAEISVDGTVQCAAMPPRAKVLPVSNPGTEHEVLVVLGSRE